MVEHGGGIVKNQSVHLSNANDDLKRVSERVRGSNEVGNEEAHWAPGELLNHQSVQALQVSKGPGTQTAVTVSMQSTNGSEVKYLESESAYSFHS